MKVALQLILSSCLLFSTLAGAAPAPARLSEPQRSDLRYRLESLFNEVDLLVRNQRSDESDRARLGRELRELKVLERIPMKTDLDGLKRELSERARAFDIRVERVELVSADSPSRPVPREIATHLPSFRIETSQLVQTLRIRLVLKGDGPAIYDWIQRWPDDQVRLIEPEKGFERPGVTQVRAGRFSVWARAYRFREIRYPRLRPRDPAELLPAWAKRQPERFARQEPMLWDYVKRIREKIPETPSLYERRAAFLLDSARMSF
ncbi:MAG TPA: hypothetical protein VM598_10770, partial [Bdellovibrionota bacterium]|nr:hypothetical protein [Bdellovibrionota bacterium]